MGKRTHGPQLLHAIEANDHAKVHEILAVQVKNKETQMGWLMSSSMSCCWVFGSRMTLLLP